MLIGVRREKLCHGAEREKSPRCGCQSVVQIGHHLPVDVQGFEITTMIKSKWHPFFQTPEGRMERTNSARPSKNLDFDAPLSKALPLIARRICIAREKDFGLRATDAIPSETPLTFHPSRSTADKQERRRFFFAAPAFPSVPAFRGSMKLTRASVLQDRRETRRRRRRNAAPLTVPSLTELFGRWRNERFCRGLHHGCGPPFSELLQPRQGVRS